MALCATAKKISSGKAEQQHTSRAKLSEAHRTKKGLLCTKATSGDLKLMRKSSRQSCKACQRSRAGFGFHSPDLSYHCNTTQKLTKQDYLN